MRSIVIALCLAGCVKPVGAQVSDLVGVLVEETVQSKCWVVKVGEPEGWDDDPTQGVREIVETRVGTESPICEIVVDSQPVDGDELIILEVHRVARRDVHQVLLAWGVPDE